MNSYWLLMFARMEVQISKPMFTNLSLKPLAVQFSHA